MGKTKFQNSWKTDCSYLLYMNVAYEAECRGCGNSLKQVILESLRLMGKGQNIQ